MDALTSPAKVRIDAFRQEFLEELPALAREYIDTARSEATTAAFEKVMNTALKVIEGLQVQEKKDQYANLPVIHVSFGPGMQMATLVEAAPSPGSDPLPGAPSADIEDAVVKSPFQTSASSEFGTLPPDPLALLDDTPGAQETLAVLNLAASAMALD